MTKEEWITCTRDEIAGAVLDLLCRRDASGHELSLLMRRLYGKINTALGEAYDAVKPHVPTNGVKR
jgi:hypothetical protein